MKIKLNKAVLGIYKKIIALIFLLCLICMAFAQTTALEQKTVNVYIFWAEGCPHCEGEIEFLQTIEQKYSDLNLVLLEVTNNKENIDLFIKVGEKLGADVGGVPFTAIGENYVKGWLNESTTGKQIEDAINYARDNNSKDVVSEINSDQNIIDPNKNVGAITLPIFGKIDPKNISLPVLTIMIAFLDGFNPCAMWVLLFLISLLLGIKDKKKMWLFGITFLLASALVYFLFMAAWLNLFMFLGFILWVRILIGIVAIGAGAYNLKDFFTNKEGGCKVTGGEKRKKVFDQLRKIIQEKSFFLALIGLIVLAFAVNLVELVCSAGLPAIYTQILVLTNLPLWQYYAYLALYIFVFMLDDLIIFILAMKTLELSGVSSKYSRYSHLVGGALMLVIGIILILKPELLMFG